MSAARAEPKVALSTSSVYPEDTAAGFEVAGLLGYDGVEVMVGIDPLAADVDAVRRLRDYHQLPVLAIHAPCLLVTQRVWGSDPWVKLERATEAANLLGADVVVVHPPFRWQRSYATRFVEGVRELAASSGVTIAVENMYPWRAPGGGEFQAYKPSWDPSDLDYDHLTLDLSHAATARQSALELVRRWDDRLAHVHLTDGNGSAKDEHLLPGRGSQRADAVLAELARRGYRGHVVLEVNTNDLDRPTREEALASALLFARKHLGQIEDAA
ncbi:MAG: sugar phosphate isomerase/epimerase family protein [Micropruina sp.]|uniref:sugar phosphate isomerase/epimerase family protein n=1 Tax=Micropruina sp. TaxID=2737536 RepID=UPI0039E64145